MKKRLSILLSALLLLGVCACGRGGEDGTEEGAYRLYFSALDDQLAALAVGYESLELEEGAQPVPALLSALLDGPTETGLSSPFPNGLRLLKWELDQEGCLRLDLSEQYGGLTGVDLTVADTCLTLTLCQVEGVESVYITVEGDEIPYRPIQQLMPENILRTADGGET